MRYDIFDGATPEFVLVFVFAFVSVSAVPASVLYFCCCLGKSIFVSVCLGFRCTQKNQNLYVNNKISKPAMYFCFQKVIFF